MKETKRLTYFQDIYNAVANKGFEDFKINFVNKKIFNQSMGKELGVKFYIPGTDWFGFIGEDGEVYFLDYYIPEGKKVIIEMI